MQSVTAAQIPRSGIPGQESAHSCHTVLRVAESVHARVHTYTHSLTQTHTHSLTQTLLHERLISLWEYYQSFNFVQFST